ncbi:unnamed protein product [Clonostachys byssicola]|uniref:Clr5 domain-containing protein n=1 Tax=Clonostachys byssicola TaxID=160290 RepID=A0A9N9YB68_9HYPO|nr:unnamed protein product [Clonostachys byssicola]
MTKPWAKNRKEIVRLYIREGRTLQEVRGIMKNLHNFDASIRSYRQWFDKWDVTKYNCKKRQQRRRMLQQYIKQEEACDDDRRSSSPALDSSSPRLPFPKELSAATTPSQDQLTGENKTPDQVAEAEAAALPKVEIGQNRDDVSPQGEFSPWYNKPSSPRQWTAATKPFNHRKRQPRRKLPQQQQQHIKQEVYTGLQSPPLDTRLPYSRPIDTQNTLPTRPEYFEYSTPRYTEPFVFTLSDKPAWQYHDGRVNPSWVDLSPSSLEYDLSVGSDTPGMYEGGSAAIEFAQSRSSAAADRDLIKL